jgi:hypothetical protein
MNNLQLLAIHLLKELQECRYVVVVHMTYDWVNTL